MSVFLSMFDHGFTSSRRVLMPYRCKFCRRYFHHFNRLKAHQGIHNRLYTKHWLELSHQKLAESSFIIKQGLELSSQYLYPKVNRSADGEDACQLSYHEDNSAIKDEKRTIVLNIPYSKFNNEQMCNENDPLRLHVSAGASVSSHKSLLVNGNADVKGQTGVQGSCIPGL